MKTQRNPLKIFLYCDGSELDGSTLKKKSLGGSETAGVQIAKALRDLGNDVTVFSEIGSNTSEGIYDGVEYISHKKYIQIATNTAHDVNIISRRHELLKHPYKSKINILWNQDHAWLNQKEDLLRTIWNCDSLFTLTECHNNQQLKVWELPKEFSWVAGNGIDLDLINDSIKGITNRDPNKLIYASRPERGLDVLVTSIFPNLLKLRPSLKLHITTYDYFPPQIIQLWERLQEFSKQFGDSIVWLPPQKKEDLYRQFASSSLFLYPANHKEGYCIVAAEALACGLPIVANSIGAIPEIVPNDAGCLLQGYGSDNTNIEFQREFITGVLELLDNKKKWEKASLSARERAKTYDWRINAERWDSKFRELISKKKENSLSVIITTKNNENTIEACLDSIKSIAKEVIVYDSASEDKTVDILGNYDCKIIKNNSSITIQGKEAIRNRCLKECSGNWVLWLNPDEQLMEVKNISKYLRNNPYDAYSICTQFISKRDYDDTLLENPVRLFRNNKDIKFYGLHCERPYKEGMKKIENIGWIADVVLLNTNTDMNYQEYFSKEFPLLDRDIMKYPNRREGLFYYIQGLTFLVNIAVKNRNYSPEVQSWANKVINIYKKHFLGKKGIFAQRALEYYSQMNKLMGMGLEVSWNINYSRGNSKLKENGSNIQFSSIEDMGELFDSFIKNRPEVLFEEYHLPGGFTWN